MTTRLEPLAKQLFRAAAIATRECRTPVLVMPDWCSLRHDFFLELGRCVQALSGMRLRIDCVTPSQTASIGGLLHNRRVAAHLKSMQRRVCKLSDGETTLELTQVVGRQSVEPSAPAIQRTFVVGYGDDRIELPDWCVAVRLLDRAARIEPPELSRLNQTT